MTQSGVIRSGKYLQQTPIDSTAFYQLKLTCPYLNLGQASHNPGFFGGVSLRRHISFWDFLTNTWPISKLYSNQVGFESTKRANFDPLNEGNSSLSGSTNDSSSASFVNNSAILGVPNK